MLAVQHYFVIEGPLYNVPAEDGELTVFDCEIVAQTEKGVFGNGHYVPGYHAAPNGDGGQDNCPNRNYKAEYEQLKASLPKEIDETIWGRLPEYPTLEERMANEAELENQERRGYR